MGLDDCDEAFDDVEARVQLDPRVWARTAENPPPSGNILNQSIINTHITPSMDISI